MNDSRTEEERAPGYSFGVVLLVFGGFLLLFARSIERRGVSGSADPGPAAFPVAIACLLIAGGLYELAATRRIRQRTGTTIGAAIPKFRFERRHVDVFVLLLALPLYIAALPWIGFNVSTFVFSSLMMKRLQASWWMALAMSLLLVVLTQLLFGRAFSVPLPTSEWGLPI